MDPSTQTAPEFNAQIVTRGENHVRVGISRSIAKKLDLPLTDKWTPCGRLGNKEVSFGIVEGDEVATKYQG